MEEAQEGLTFRAAALKVLPEHLLHDETEVSALLSVMTCQTTFCIDELAAFLTTNMRFNKSYALTTARQIVPKVFFYSTVVRSRSGCVGLLDSLKNLGTSCEVAALKARRRLFIELAPEITAYLFDQTIDNFNPGRVATAVQEAVDLAATKLCSTSNHYWELLKGVLRSCIADATYGVADMDDEHRSFSLLVPYVRHLQIIGAKSNEIETVIKTLADVLTLEHLAELAFPADGKFFPTYQDLLKQPVTTLPQFEHQMPASLAVGYAIASNGGTVMVVANHYLLYKYTDCNTPASFRSMAQLLDDIDELHGTLRFLAGVIRVGDDIGDLSIDLEVHAPNLFVFNDEAKKHFLDYCLLDTFNVKPYAEKFIIAAVMDRPDFRNDILPAMLDIEQKLYELLRRRCAGQEDLLRFVEIMAGVVWGSLLNAVLDDRQAEQIGIALHSHQI